MLRSLNGGSRVLGFVLVAVFSQIFRNWLLLHAVGIDASLFDATAVLIAVVTLGQLPVGPGVGAAAAVLILGSDGVVAAGVLMTAAPTGSGPSVAGPRCGVLVPELSGRAERTVPFQTIIGGEFAPDASRSSLPLRARKRLRRRGA